MLISTKFHRPLTAARLTLRPRLEARLNEGLQAGCLLVLVTAPAGFGKSTLVSAWLQDQIIPSSWLSLDGNDNDPGEFLSYLVGALQVIDPTIGAAEMNRIQTAAVADSEAVYADVMKNLVNEIAGQSSPFILALDDCHVLKNRAVLGLLNFLIDHQPPQFRLILLSREDLPLPVSRLRVRRQVVEIRQADLLFSPEEAEDFLREGMGIRQLTSQDILALEQCTEGWIAGLQLAGLSMRSDPDPSHFIKSFTGSDRYILDYFMEEVFTRQSEEIQNFLLATSVLERFCAPLTDAVRKELYRGSAGAMGNPNAILEQLERSNLFLIPLDNQRRWYRYHHLFSDLLKHALSQTYADKLPALHLQASHWFEENGFIPEAVEHAFQTQDWTYAAEMVERHAWNMIIHSQVGIASEWCRTFPEQVISRHPALCIFHAWAFIIGFKSDDFPSANIRLGQAEASLSRIDPEEYANVVLEAPPVRIHPWVTGQIILLRSFILMSTPRNQADPQGLVDFGQLAYDRLPEEDIPARSAALLDICYASQALSKAEEAEIKFEETVRVALSGHNYFGAVIGEYHRAHGLLEQGRLQQVISFCRQKRQEYASFFKDPLKELPALALLDQAEGCALLEMNELSEAERLLRSGLEVGQWMPREELPGYLALARLCLLKDDQGGMADALRRLDMRWPDIRYCTEAVRLVNELLCHPGDPETRRMAAAWAIANHPEIGEAFIIPGIGPAWHDEADHAVYVAWALIQILLGKSAEALSVIQPMLAVALENRLVHRIIELSLLEAQAYYAQGHKEHAWKPLLSALSLGEKSGYRRFMNINPVCVSLLKEALKSGIAPVYLRVVLEINAPASVQADPGIAPVQVIASGGETAATGGLIEPLSNREREVIILMGQGLSNSEIAARLYLSPNTLKAHTQNIYGKLDVHNRVQAINKARDLGLI